MLFPHELYQKMTPELAASSLAYLRKEDRDTYKTGLSSLAIQRKLRPAFIQKRSGDKQIEWMVDMLKLRTSVAVGEHMLQTWLMKEHTDMLVMLLDKLEIDHDGEGSVEGELPEELDSEKLEDALELLLAKKPAEVVAVYLHMFKLQRPVDWDNLGKLLSSDPRLAIGGEQPAAEVEPGAEVEAEVADESEPAEEESELPPSEESAAESEVTPISDAEPKREFSEEE